MEAVEVRPASREMKPQPLEAVNVPGVLLNVRTVEIAVGFGKTKINADAKAGKFPPGIRLSRTCTRWLSDDIRWYNQLRAQGKDWVPRPGAESTQ